VLTGLSEPKKAALFSALVVAFALVVALAIRGLAGPTAELWRVPGSTHVGGLRRSRRSTPDGSSPSSTARS
jgi:hypothetical protein